MDIYLRIVFEGGNNFEPDREFETALLGAQYNEAVKGEDYSVAESIMEKIKGLTS